jgi:uncharacterized protein YbbC (DUF1343 family)
MDLYPDDFVISRPQWMNKLWGNTKANEMFEANAPAEDIIKTYEQDVAAFEKLSKKYLMY